MPMPTSWGAPPSIPPARIPVCLALALASISCNDSTAPEATPALTLAPAEVALVPGGESRLEVRAPSEDTAEPLDPVDWSSSDPDVATVDPEGRVTAVAEGTTWIRASAADASDSTEVRVTLLEIRALVTGFAHVCGLTVEDEAWCWGRGAPLGDSIGEPTELPVRVAGGHRFQQLDASMEHTCGLTLQGRAYCWGSVSLGIETGECTAGRCETVVRSLVPVAVEGALTFTSISAGAFSSCGLTPEGSAYCWSNRPPSPVDGDLRFVQVSRGWIHACGLTADGEIYCWGDDRHGQLGTGEVGGRFDTPVRAKILGEDRFKAVLATVHEVSCGIRMDDVLLCWGHNDTGQLGRGFQSSSEVTAETPVGLGPVRSVTGGVFHLCAVALDGAGYCWGGAPIGVGELGHGVPEPSDVPVQVVDVASFEEIDAGTHVITCGLDTEGLAYCWGQWDWLEDTGSLHRPTLLPGQRGSS